MQFYSDEQPIGHNEISMLNNTLFSCHNMRIIYIEPSSHSITQSINLPLPIFPFFLDPLLLAFSFLQKINIFLLFLPSISFFFPISSSSSCYLLILPLFFFKFFLIRQIPFFVLSGSHSECKMLSMAFGLHNISCDIAVNGLEAVKNGNYKCNFVTMYSLALSRLN